MVLQPYALFAADLRELGVEGSERSVAERGVVVDIERVVLLVFVGIGMRISAKVAIVVVRILLLLLLLLLLPVLLLLPTNIKTTAANNSNNTTTYKY